MTVVRIMLVNTKQLVEFYLTENVVQLAKNLMESGDYVDIGTLSVEQKGYAAAEEMFNLTNNPSRQEERKRLYGEHRSLSVGDIVIVDGRAYLCTSNGWEKV